jgi:hypothetical protein
MKSEAYVYLYKLIEDLPIVSSHEHHFPGAFHRGLTLDRLFENSYLINIAGSTGKSSSSARDYFAAGRGKKMGYSIPVDESHRRGEFLGYCRYNSYYVWLEKALQRIYQFDEKISPENWDHISHSIAQKHSTDRVFIDLLREKAGYHRAVLDPFWDYGSDLGHPEFYSPTMRTDMFVTSFHPDAPDHDGNSPFVRYPDAPTKRFDDYLDYLTDMFTRWHEAGAVAMKSASAYDRSIAYGESDRNSAARVFYKHPSEVIQAERVAYEDYMFNWFCRLCSKFDVPFQIHTGLGKISGSRPIFLEPVILRYPEVHFVLFHAGYPWYDEMAGLLHNHSNISVDMVWVPLISTSGAVSALHEFIEVSHSSDLIGWGGDAFTAEESYGALLAWRHVMAKVLSEKVEDEYLNLAEAESLAQKLASANVAQRYGLNTPG